MRRTLASSLVLTLALGAAPAFANVPSAANSTVPACLSACPLGDMPITIVVRDIASNPVGFSQVVLEFANCPGFYLCPIASNDPYTGIPGDPTAVRAFTNSAGSVTFPLRAGGGCAANTVNVFADGVLLAQRAFSSPDQNGDGVVLSADQALLAAKVGGSDPTGDLDCSGTVTAADQTIAGQHGSHSCNGIVNPVQRRSWGMLKAHYH